MGRVEWWKLDNGKIKIYTENLEGIENFPTPSTIHYKKKSVKGNKAPIFAVEYITEFGSEEQKEMFGIFGIKNKHKVRS